MAISSTIYAFRKFRLCTDLFSIQSGYEFNTTGIIQHKTKSSDDLVSYYLT